MDQNADAKWLKLTNHGEWATHTVSAAHYNINNSCGGQIVDSWPQFSKIKAWIKAEKGEMGGYKQESCWNAERAALIVFSSCL